MSNIIVVLGIAVLLAELKAGPAGTGALAMWFILLLAAIAVDTGRLRTWWNR